jgi:hypothetical protein
MRWWWYIWGGGHTLATDPTKVWRSHYNSDSHAVLIGRHGVVGCFSARQMSGGRLDVAFYTYETPEEVLKAWKAGEGPDADFRILNDLPGWGLHAIEILTGLMQERAA